MSCEHNFFILHVVLLGLAGARQTSYFIFTEVLDLVGEECGISAAFHNRTLG